MELTAFDGDQYRASVCQFVSLCRNLFLGYSSVFLLVGTSWRNYRYSGVKRDHLCPEETLDGHRLGGLKIIQARNGYRFSLDPILLCNFARVGKGETVFDLGTGAGVIPLVLAKRSQATRVVGIELQPQLADRALRSAVLNDLEERVEIRCTDIREVRDWAGPQSADVVVCNPPFRVPGSGRIAPGDERAAARHEISGSLDDFLVAAVYLLPDGGRFYIIHLAERLAELLALMQQRRLTPKRLRCVHSREGEAARLVLVEGRRGGGGGMRVEAPLYVYAGENYTAEVLAMYGE